MTQEERIKQVGYMPTSIEDEKINAIAQAYHLTRVNVLRNLIHSHLNMDELYQYAQKILIKRDGDDYMDISDALAGDTIIM